MRKDILLPGLAMAGGTIGLALRQWQIASAFYPETQLFAHGAPATLALLALMLGLAAVLALLILSGDRSSSVPAVSLRCPSPIYMAGMAAGTFLFFGAGVLGLLRGLDELLLWRLDPEGHLLTYPAALLVCAVLCFPSGLACLMLGKGAYRGQYAPSSPLLALFPAFTSLVWLFATHLGHSTDPIFMGYGFSLLSAALLMLAHYGTAAAFHGRPHPRRTMFCAFLGTVLAITSLGDGLSPFFAVLSVAFAVSALAQAAALARSAFGPPWPRRLLEGRMPSGAQDEDDEDPDNDQHFTEEF